MKDVKGVKGGIDRVGIWRRVCLCVCMCGAGAEWGYRVMTVGAMG